MENKSKLKEFLRVIKFTIISISAGLIQIGLFALLNEVLKWNYWLSYLLSLLASILWNFTINRKVTFKAANNVNIAMLKVLLFYAIFTPVSTVLGEYCENNGVNEYIVLAVTMISNFVLEFLYTRFFVYGKSVDSALEKSKNNSKRGKGLFFKLTVFCIKLFYRKREYIGIENLNNKPCIIISNHAQIHGPLAAQLFFPETKLIWTIGEMMNIKEVPSYAFSDFWSYKPKWNRWFFKLLSYIIAPFSAYYFKRADTIAVYKDARLRNTFKDTINGLENGENIIIFPECPTEYNDIVNEFQDKFVDVAEMYYRKYKKEVNFVPMYVAARLKKVVLGKPIKYNPSLKIEEQRKVITTYLKEEITNLAKDLPIHKVLPYNNVGRKNYRNSK